MRSTKTKVLPISDVFDKFFGFVYDITIPVLFITTVIGSLFVIDSYKQKLTDLHLELYKVKKEITSLENSNKLSNLEVCYLTEANIK